ncbi:hypothetical protein EC55P2_00028 [Enterococcus phage EC55P2]|nr:hypothetical protein EC55P2_00028 [Enterococcus phage EC55P2]
MKPNWKDYLIATGQFLGALTAAVSLMALILLTIFVLTTYKVVAIGIGFVIGIAALIWFVGGWIHLLAVTNALDRLDKDDEM